MIISSNIEPHKELFNYILSTSINTLNAEALKNPSAMKKLAGTYLEQYVTDLMLEQAKGTPFEDTIVCDGGISFPDIIANKYYGVEVKTTVKNHWKTTGNSVLETTRKKDVERIYLLFGKLGDPIEFRYRAYEECLAEVVVTHSPRYLIDMNLAEGATIFNKIKIPYDVLRKRERPLEPLVDYYKSKLKTGEKLWWTGAEKQEAASLIIRAWSNLSNAERKDYRIKGFAFFPEIFGESLSKFNRFAIWLPTTQGIVCPNVRDNFSAGGKIDLKVGNKTYLGIPKVFGRLYDIREDVRTLVNSQSIEDLSSYWQQNVKANKKIDLWLKLVQSYSKEILPSKYHDLVVEIFSN